MNTGRRLAQEIWRYAWLALAVAGAATFHYHGYQKGRWILEYADPAPLVSAGAFLFIYLIFLRASLRFWQTLMHELTHAFFALMTFNKPMYLAAGARTDMRAGVAMYRGRGNWAVTLSPYFFPLHTSVIIAVGMVVAAEYREPIRHLAAVSYSFYLVTLASDFSYRQDDIQKAGPVYSTVMVTALNSLVFCTVMAYILDLRWTYGQIWLSVISDVPM